MINRFLGYMSDKNFVYTSKIKKKNSSAWSSALVIPNMTLVPYYTGDVWKQAASLNGPLNSCLFNLCSLFWNHKPVKVSLRFHEAFVY